VIRRAVTRAGRATPARGETDDRRAARPDVALREWIDPRAAQAAQGGVVALERGSFAPSAAAPSAELVG